MKCNNFEYSGKGSCDALLGRAVGVLLMNKGTTLADPTILTTYRTIIAADAGITGMYLPIKRGFVNNTAEPERTTGNTGHTEKTSDPLGMYVGYFDGNFDDYKILWDADGKDFDAVYFLEDGTVFHATNSSGVADGFRVGLTVRKNAMQVDNREQMYPVYLDMQYIQDMDTAAVSKLAFKIKELVDTIPVGLDIEVVTAYTAGVVVLRILLRGTQRPFTAIADENNLAITSQVYKSPDLDVAVTDVDVTSASTGVYSVTIKKDSSTTPADLTAGLYVHCFDDDGTYKTYLSDPELIAV